jgi:hypothetical protein
VHLALHWTWVCTVVRGWFWSSPASNSSSARIRRNLLGAGVLAGIALALAGFVWIARANVVERPDEGEHLRGASTRYEQPAPERRRAQERIREGRPTDGTER